MSSMKLVVIGGGSSYTPELADGLIKKAGCPSRPGDRVINAPGAHREHLLRFWAEEGNH